MFYWQGEEYELNYWVCNDAPMMDICRTKTLEELGDASNDKSLDDDSNRDYIARYVRDTRAEKPAYILHRQKNKTVISYGQYKKDSYWPYRLIEFGEGMDTYFGSSGGMLVDAETHTPIGVHTSGSEEKQQNYATSLEALP